MPISQSIMAQFEVLNPRAAALLSIVDPTGLARTHTLKAEDNLIDSRIRCPEFLHDPSGAFDEAVRWVSNHNVEQVDFLVVFGIGCGWHWKALLPWLQRKKNRRVVVVEDDLAVVQAFLESELATSFFDDQQSTLLFLEEGDESKHVKEMIAWYAYEKAWSSLPSPAYARYRMEAYQALSIELAVLHTDVSAALREFLDFATSPIKNFGRTIFSWQRSLQASSLFDQFRGCPAIVVAAGPSLDREIELLRKVDSKALIFAGGSSVNALLQAGIIPHFAATVDPNPMQYVRLRQTQPFCLPVLYRARALYEALMFQNGPLLYLRGGDGYPLVEWFEHAVGIHGKVLDGGHSVSNLIIEAAYAMGCRSIILVGYDLAYTGGARYTQSLAESMHEGEKIVFEGTTQGYLLEGKTYDGRNVLSEAKWMTEAHWIEQFAEKHPRLQVMNTTEDGLAIKGLTRMTLADALEAHCVEDRDIRSLVHVAIAEAKPAAYDPERLSKAIERMSDSFQKVEGLLVTMRQQLVKTDMGQGDPPELLEAGAELEDQIAFQQGLSNLFRMHTKLSTIRKYFDARPLLDEAKAAEFDRRMLKDRLRLLMDSTKHHLSFLYTMVAWGCLNGHVLPRAGSITPLQGTEVKL